MSCIFKYFSLLYQLKGYKARNKLVTMAFDLIFGYKKGCLADSEVVCMCPVIFVYFKLEAFL